MKPNEQPQAPALEEVRLALDLLRVELRPADGDKMLVGSSIMTEYGQPWPVFRFAEMKSPHNHRANAQIAEALQLVVAAAIENMLKVCPADDGRQFCKVCHRAAPLIDGECPDCRH